MDCIKTDILLPIAFSVIILYNEKRNSASFNFCSIMKFKIEHRHNKQQIILDLHQGNENIKIFAMQMNTLQTIYFYLS